jgi:hypothetical protein
LDNEFDFHFFKSFHSIIKSIFKALIPQLLLLTIFKSQILVNCLQHQDTLFESKLLFGCLVLLHEKVHQFITATDQAAGQSSKNRSRCVHAFVPHGFLLQERQQLLINDLVLDKIVDKGTGILWRKDHFSL